MSSKIKKYKIAIVYLNGIEVSCNKKQLQKYVSSFNTNRVSWFNDKDEALKYIKTDLNRKKKIFITKGYKHPYQYDVWFNE